MVTVWEGYRIRPGRIEDGPACVALEQAAGAMFRDSPHPEIADHPVTDPATFATPAAEERLLVVVAPPALGKGEELVVAAAILALAERDGGRDAHLAEFDVLPAHQGRGVGARLLDACADWGRARGAARMTLTTYRDVPWNQPYYERRGFREIPEADGNAETAHELALGIEEGWGGSCRVVMARPIPLA